MWGKCAAYPCSDGLRNGHGIQLQPRRWSRKILIGVEGWSGSSSEVFLTLRKGHKEGRPFSPDLWTVLGEVPMLPPFCLINMLKMVEQKEEPGSLSHQITPALCCPDPGRDFQDFQSHGVRSMPWAAPATRQLSPGPCPSSLGLVAPDQPVLDIILVHPLPL